MFKRHWKVTQERLNRLSAIEDRRKQDAFLEKTYKERMLEREEDDDESNSDWDPIDDVLEDNRGNFISKSCLLISILELANITISALQVLCKTSILLLDSNS